MAATPPTSPDKPERINVALHPDTHKRLMAVKNNVPLQKRTFNDAVNDILNVIDFPAADEIENAHFPNFSFEAPDSDDDGDEDED